MAGIPHTKSPKRIPRLLKHIQDSSTPDKVTIDYLESNDFTSSNDRSLMGLLRGIKFVDSAGKPTERWKAYKDKPQAPNVLEDAIRVGYPSLFTAYPQAQQRTDKDIAAVIRNTTKFAESDIALAVASFRILCGGSSLVKAVDTKKMPPSVVPAVSAHRAKATIKTNDSIDIAESELMDQARKCVEHDLFLPAHVMAWAAFMDFVFEKLSVDLDALRNLRPTWHGADIREMAESVSERNIVGTLQELGFCSKNQLDRFISLLERRNDCAHPAVGHRPDLDETKGYISELIKRAEPLIGMSL